MKTFRFAIVFLILVTGCRNVVYGQDQEESLESKLNLQPLPALNLIDGTPVPPPGIWHPQNRVFNDAIRKHQWVWQPPPPAAAPDKQKRQRRNQQNPNNLLPNKTIDPVIRRNDVTLRYELAEILTKRFLDLKAEIVFHAEVASPNGGLMLGKIEDTPKLVGRQNLGGIVVDQYVTKFAQLKLYQKNPDYIELRFFHRTLQKEVLPPGTPARIKRRETTQIQQVCPTLILQSKSSLKDVKEDSVVPASAADAGGAAKEGNQAVGRNVMAQNNGQRLAMDSSVAPRAAMLAEPGEIDNQGADEFSIRSARMKVVRFENRGDHVSFEKEIDMSSPFTIEAIFNMRREGADMTIVNADSVLLSADASPEPIVLETYNPNRLGRLVPIQVGVWNHIAMVYSGVELRFFANGKLTGRRNVRSWNSGNKLVISREDGRLPFLGDLREVRISNIARYDDAFDPPTTLAHDPQTLVLLNAEDVQGDRWPGRGSGDYVGKLRGAYPAVAPDLAENEESSKSDSMTTTHATFEVINPTILKPLRKGTRLFSNRPAQIFTTDPPARFRNWSFTQHDCFEPPTYEIDVLRPGLVFIASSSASEDTRAAMIRALMAEGWSQLDEPSELLDGNQEGNAVERPWPIFSKYLNSGKATLPIADGRCGTIILVPPRDFIP